MNVEKQYWLAISIFGIIHLHNILLNLPIAVPIYVSIIIVLMAVFFLQKRIILHISSIGLYWNCFLFLMQILLVSFYLIIDPSWIFLTPFILFLMLEMIRIQFAAQIDKLERKVERFTTEREQMNETFRIVRAERHDFLKHISSLHYMLENRNETEAKSYLDDLVDGYEETNLSIKGERGTVAAILQQMYKQATAKGIEMIYDFDHPLSSLPPSDQELTSLLGNLLSNSIEACAEWQTNRQGKAIITVQFYKRAGLYVLNCKNNSLPIPTTILDHLFVTFGKTTKSGAHEGLGTKIIDDIVKRHQGFLDFVYKREQFSIKIKIPAIK